ILLDAIGPPELVAHVSGSARVTTRKKRTWPRRLTQPKTATTPCERKRSELCKFSPFSFWYRSPSVEWLTYSSIRCCRANAKLSNVFGTWLPATRRCGQHAARRNHAVKILKRRSRISRSVKKRAKTFPSPCELHAPDCRGRNDNS